MSLVTFSIIQEFVRKGPFPVQSVESSHVGFYCTSDGHVQDYMVQAIQGCDERCGQYMMVRYISKVYQKYKE